MNQSKLREINLSGCEEIGKGQCSSVYRIAEDRVVKLYFNTISEKSIQTEVDKTMEGNHLSIDAAKCYGLVTCDGRIGLELECINGTTVQEALLDHPELLEEYAKKTALQLRKIHSAKPDSRLFTDVRDFYLSCIQGCEKDGYISESEGTLLRAFVLQVPSCPTMVHGDYHILNIMQEKGKIRLIDLADCMTGHPIYDLLVFHLYMHVMPLAKPELCQKLVGLPSKQLLAFNDIFIRTYFELPSSDNKAFEKIEKTLDVYSMLKMILAPHSFSNMKPGEGGEFVELGRKQFLPVIKEYTGIIPSDILELAKI